VSLSSVLCHIPFFLHSTHPISVKVAVLHGLARAFGEWCVFVCDYIMFVSLVVKRYSSNQTVIINTVIKHLRQRMDSVPHVFKCMCFTSLDCLPTTTASLHIASPIQYPAPSLTQKVLTALLLRLHGSYNNAMHEVWRC